MSATYLLDELLEKQRNKREQSRQQTIDIVLKTLDKLAEEVSFENAYIFGSLARSFGFTAISDIDIGFLGLPDGDFFPAMAFLSRELKRDVDIVQLEGHRLESKVMKEGISWKKLDRRS